MALIEAKDVVKKYKVGSEVITALDGINLSIEKGEFIAILGTSGCGKSTLLNMLSGLERPTKGDIIINGVRINKVNEKNMSRFRSREMGFIFQQMYMMKNLTILDNILLPAMESKKSKESKKEKLERGEELMRKLGIMEVADNDINEVSGGQLQRACICRSMINKPKVLFADEPTGALNRTASNEVMEELVKLNQEGTTIMMVTHDVKVASKCSRVLYIVDGNIKGEYISPVESDVQEKDRERRLNNWLMEQGW